ncbi:hypothetical protein BS50DRAFT_568151 [Corynespora cassiicola Philippines]|uniref:Glycosyltransferase family 28 N-terminal domain-containing protein n=1 Tax=Corynespora cassiicola Philippines TaxID=1448308 RepID=A0A2T2PCW5_CORCC|nr:hypothetical protein BS50DRAFT_568151 [Corynespora cassiicola Philippines]
MAGGNVLGFVVLLIADPGQGHIGPCMGLLRMVLARHAGWEGSHAIRADSRLLPACLARPPRAGFHLAVAHLPTALEAKRPQG